MRSINGTGDSAAGTYYSLTGWVAARASTVAKQFNFQWDAVIQDDPATPGLTDGPTTGSSDPNPPSSGTDASTSDGVKAVAAYGLAMFVVVAGLWVL